MHLAEKKSQEENLDLATKWYPESQGGILICGLNWGEGKKGEIEQPVTEPSFFSDGLVF